MLILEYKLITSQEQANAIGEALRVVQFTRNKALRLWMDTNAKPYDLNKYCAILAREYPFADALNSQARQAAAERAAYAISRYLKPDKTGKRLRRPRFQRDENAARNILRLALAVLDLRLPILDCSLQNPKSQIQNRTYPGALGNVEGNSSETLGEIPPLLPACAG